MVIVITGVIFALGGLIVSEGFRPFAHSRDVADADWQGRLALARMVRELRAVRSASPVDLTTVPDTEIRFFDNNGNGVCFYRNGTTLMRSADGPGTACDTTTPQPLADGVTALQFQYWRTDGVTGTTTETEVYYITVNVTVAKADYVGSFETTVYGRNFDQ
jgi:hypothetical protein